MADDSLFDLFALDPLDFLAWAPLPQPSGWGLSQPLLDPTAPFVLEDQLIIAGAGFPRFWENIGNIVGGAGDLLSKVGAMFTELWDTTWRGIGGALRYAYDNVQANVDRVWNRVSDVFSNTWSTASIWSGWVRDNLYEARDVVVGKVEERASWVWGHVDATWNALTGTVTDWIGWLNNQLVDARDRLMGLVIDWSTWLWDNASRAFQTIERHLSDWSTWLWGNVVEAFNDFRGLFGRVDDFLRLTLFPAVAGAAQDIVGGLSSGFEFVIDNLERPLGFLADRFQDLARFLINDAWEPTIGWFEDKFNLPMRVVRGDFATFEDFWAEAIRHFPAPLLIPLFLVAMLAINAISTVTSSMLEEGIEPMVQNQRARIASRTLFTTDLQDLLNRGLIDESVFLDHQARFGYSEANARHLMALRLRIPSPTDLIRFGVREVFTPEIAERFGQFEDFPPEFANQMALVGYDRDRALQFWAAHWDLPSATQGFEMMHREVISFDDLQLLLRALDVMPFWRDKLTQIAFRVITRVDIRRLYQDGVVDEAKVKRTYLDLGYTDEDAQALTDMVKIRYPRGGRNEAPDLRDLTISQVRSAYVRRLIDRPEALDRLVQIDFPEEDADLLVSIWDFDLAQNPAQRSDLDFRNLSRSLVERAYERRLFDFNRALVEIVELGYSQEDAELILALVDQRQAEDLTELEIDAALNDFDAGAVDIAQVESRLRDFGLADERIAFLAQRAVLQRQVKRRRLTVSQLQRAFRAGLIATPEELLDRLTALGYNNRDAAILVGLT